MRLEAAELIEAVTGDREVARDAAEASLTAAWPSSAPLSSATRSGAAWARR
jgi:hypothetical protein